MAVDRTVIISGGTFGIGRGIVIEMARRGWNVVGFGLDKQQLGSAAKNGINGTKASLLELGLTADILEADVSNSQQVQGIIEHTLDRFGHIHGLVNNAAIRPVGNILETDEKIFDQTIAVNLKGQFLACKAVIPCMQAVGGGSIVNIASGAGWGKAGLLAYSASKGGIFALSAALAYDHLEDHIRVNVVVPGPQTESGMVEHYAGLKSSPAVLTVSGRNTRPSDIANAAAFLLSDDAEQISGSVLDVGTFANQGALGQPRS